MPETRPVISVLMTAFNGGAFLADSVRSVLHSSFVDLELVLLDNRSTDGSIDALRSVVVDPRLRLIREERNWGIPHGTNLAFAHARGDFVAVVDQDDLVHRERFSRQIERLRSHPEDAGVGSRAQKIDQQGTVIGQEFTLHTAEEHRSFTRFSQAAIFGTYLFRRKLLEEFPRREIFPFSSDYDFVARVADSQSLTCLPEVLFSYRIHRGQTTTQRRREQIAAECAIRLLTAQRRSGQSEDVEKVQSWMTKALQSEFTAEDIYRAAVAECERQGFSLLETYHARRLLGVSRHPRQIVFAVRHAKNLRLFFRGPLRTFRLKPWPANLG